MPSGRLKLPESGANWSLARSLRFVTNRTVPQMAGLLFRDATACLAGDKRRRFARTIATIGFSRQPPTKCMTFYAPAMAGTDGDAQAMCLAQLRLYLFARSYTGIQPTRACGRHTFLLSVLTIID